MDLLEFAEKTSPTPLSGYQKEIFKMYDKALKENKIIFVCYPSRSGRGMVLDIIKQYKEQSKNCMTS